MPKRKKIFQKYECALTGITVERYLIYFIASRWHCVYYIEHCLV
jgi:hypothetical protein